MIEIGNSLVLKATLKNQLLQLRGKSLGVSMVKVYLADKPEVFDIFSVTVGSVITPASPVHVHVGGEVRFSVS